MAKVPAEIAIALNNEPLVRCGPISSHSVSAAPKGGRELVCSSDLGHVGMPNYIYMENSDVTSKFLVLKIHVSIGFDIQYER